MATEKWSSLHSPGLGLPPKCGLVIVSPLDRAAEVRTRPRRGPRRGKGGACGFLEARKFIPVQEALGILWGF